MLPSSSLAVLTSNHQQSPPSSAEAKSAGFELRRSRGWNATTSTAGLEVLANGEVPKTLAAQGTHLSPAAATPKGFSRVPGTRKGSFHPQRSPSQGCDYRARYRPRVHLALSPL